MSLLNGLPLGSPCALPCMLTEKGISLTISLFREAQCEAFSAGGAGRTQQEEDGAWHFQYGVCVCVCVFSPHRAGPSTGLRTWPICYLVGLAEGGSSCRPLSSGARALHGPLFAPTSGLLWPQIHGAAIPCLYSCHMSPTHCEGPSACPCQGLDHRCLPLS